MIVAHIAGVLFYLGVQVPASGFVQMAEMDDFKSECPDCHELYYPSLLPSASWALMMANMEDHFGEDASLSQDTSAAIAAYFERYACEAWDSEAANRLRVVDPENPPLRITELRWFKGVHSEREAQRMMERLNVKPLLDCGASPGSDTR